MSTTSFKIHHLYDVQYSQQGKGNKAMAKVRQETYGLDLGQSSWMTVQELDQDILSYLSPKENDDTSTTKKKLLEIGCGTGGTALYIAQQYPQWHVVGIDVNAHGIATANQDLQRLVENEDTSEKKNESTNANLLHRCSFLTIDASQTTLPFPEESFDAILSIDTMCHIPHRSQILQDWMRLLKPHGRLAYTDAMVITGIVSSQEIAIRSSIGTYYYVGGMGVNEELITKTTNENSSMELIHVLDTTDQAAQVAKQWHQSRESFLPESLGESQEHHNGMQNFLWSVHTLLAEHRLSRFLYVAQKKGT